MIKNLRSKIIDYINSNPECRLKDIATNLNCNSNTILYHLKKLKKCGKIIELDLYYYPAMQQAQHEIKIIPVLPKKVEKESKKVELKKLNFKF